MTEEEVALLQQVFNETLVILEETLARNREQWKCSLTGKFRGNRVLDPKFLARILFHRWRQEEAMISFLWVTVSDL